MVDVVQLARAPDCGSGGRGFEPHHPPHAKAGTGSARSGFASPNPPAYVRYGDVAKLVKAPDFDSGMRRFKSCHPCHFHPPPITEYDPLAQSAEHLPFKQGVRSSNLRWITRKKKSRERLFSFWCSFLSSLFSGSCRGLRDRDPRRRRIAAGERRPSQPRLRIFITGFVCPARSLRCPGFRSAFCPIPPFPCRILIVL